MSQSYTISEITGIFSQKSQIFPLLCISCLPCI